MWPVHAFFRWFNWGFDKMSGGYGWLVGRMVRFAALMLVVYAGIIAFGMNEFRKTPIGFIPQLDAGYLITVTQLPPAASLARTDEVNRRAVELALEVPGVAHAVNIVGFSGATRTNASNAGAVFVVAEAVRGAGQGPQSVGAGHSEGAARQVLDDPGRAGARRRAAARARHRQRRRLPHDDPGSRRPRARRRCSKPSAP